MLGKKWLLLSLLGFLFFGIGIDLLRPILLDIFEKSAIQFPLVLLYDVIIDLLFVLTFYWLSIQTHKISLSKVLSICFIFLGLYIVCLPLLNGTRIVPSTFFPKVFNSLLAHRNLAGTFILILGLENFFFRMRNDKYNK
jgi:hypothetical protein